MFANSRISILRASADSYLSADGAGLFCGVLRHFLDKGSGCPKVLVATHFYDVFNEEILDPESIPVSFCHMQVMFASKSGDIIDPSATFDRSPNTSVVSPSTPPTQDDMGERNLISSREKITYLYR